MNKLKRSKEQVENYMKQQNHELMLKQELRKLRTEDIAKVQSRKKRQAQNDKAMIMEKEKNAEQLTKQIKDREKILIETRHTNMMKSNLSKVSHMENLEKWARRGFSTSHSTKKTVDLRGSGNLFDLSKKASSPFKLKPYEAPDE